MTVLDLFRLDGRRALVTGGGGGLGRAIAHALAEAGAIVCVAGRSSAASDTATAIGGHALQVDLSRRGERARLVEMAAEALDGLDILVAAHGTNHIEDAATYAVERWDDVLQVNLTSVFELCQSAGRIFLSQKCGKIITIASMLSFSGGLQAAGYAASKGGVAQLTKAFANEWASSGVNVNAIAPGYIKTNLNQHIWRDNPERSVSILARLPAGRWGEPTDVQGAAVFLASRAADYVHGAILPVDGGWLSR